jgi:hypothetical protein
MIGGMRRVKGRVEVADVVVAVVMHFVIWFAAGAVCDSDICFCFCFLSCE